MEYQEIISEAISTLSINKLRTGLAVLGIIIGIGSVIALVSLGQSSQKAIENQIQSLGANLLTISPSGQNNGGVRTAVGSSVSLTKADATSLKNISNVNQISPEYSSRSQVVAGRNNTNTQIIGVEPQYEPVHKIIMESGTFISSHDVSGVTKVAVLGAQAAIDLFGEGNNPIGQTIRVQTQTLKVIGITQAKGGTGFNNPDDAIYIPLSTAQKQLFGSDSLTTISVEATNKDQMEQTRTDIGYALLARHKLSDPAQADFIIFSQNDILNTASQVTGTFTALLGGIAAISLLVGGIGIMNIMLVTVTERTREIGLRKALGAKKAIITQQFLIEAILLTVSGGIIGMILGILISFILSKVINSPFTISIPAIALATIVSGAIGIIFGWYPAQKAASLQPIEALRYE